MQWLSLWSCAEKSQTNSHPGNFSGGRFIPADNDFNLNDIVDNGELIMLTLTGPRHYDYHGRGLGTQYMLLRNSQTIGVSLRVEVCKDTAELVSRLKDGDGDIATFQLPKSIKGVQFCGVGMIR